MTRKLTIVFFSPTGTTRKVVSAVADGTGLEYDVIDLTLTSSRIEAFEFGSDDLVIMGVPVYAGRVPALLSETLASIKAEGAITVPIVVYGNRHYDDSLMELKDILEEKGAVCIAAAAFIGEHSYTDKVGSGRPDSVDLESAKQFGSELKSILNMERDTFVQIDVPGNRPYRERKPSKPVSPVTSDACIECGICARTCPTGAIAFHDFSAADSSLCIKCCSCIKKCPVDAKSFEDESVSSFAGWLEANCSGRKHPELFIPVI